MSKVIPSETVDKKRRVRSKYYQTHREEVLRKRKKKYMENPEKYREYMRHYRTKLEEMAKQYHEKGLPQESFSEFRRRMKK